MKKVQKFSVIGSKKSSVDSSNAAPKYSERRTSRDKFPWSVPIFTPSMICKGALNGEEIDEEFRGQHCAMGWIFTSLPTKRARRTALRTLKALINIAHDNKDFDQSEFFDIPSWNDSDDIHTNRIAKYLNLTMALLGYTRNNPESYRVAKYRDKVAKELRNTRKWQEQYNNI